FKAFKLLLIRWLVYYYVAFYQIENAYFVKLIQHLNKSLAKLLPTRNIVRKWVIGEFKK
ncbi:uncharacterized protein K441DRAFT_586441, partial [Cenococcum geophilum 1.58]|uniref:uncharacterized protein n=1 Tax=Cenococcum geophilum 1.58 TaxID=794803 RepID=UPI00358F9314